MPNVRIAARQVQGQPPMDAQTTTEGLLIVAESGSTWTSWIRACLDNPDDTATIAQYPDEPCSAFASRAVERVAHHTALGWIPQSAVLALDPTRAGHRHGDRVAIGQALVSSLGGRAGSQLLLAGDSGFAAAARHDVFELAQRLMAPGSPIDIHVRFTAKPTARVPHPVQVGIRPLSTPRLDDPRLRAGQGLLGRVDALAS